MATCAWRAFLLLELRMKNQMSPAISNDSPAAPMNTLMMVPTMVIAKEPGLMPSPM